ncbi:hypothetical protein C8R44DRAFT_732811 [Mycena epipterygia]|nr:hypothetical protein C8R44DRAFT_732811 [Mycena epipterygia]
MKALGVPHIVEDSHNEDDIDWDLVTSHTEPEGYLVPIRKNLFSGFVTIVPYFANLAQVVQFLMQDFRLVTEQRYSNIKAMKLELQAAAGVPDIQKGEMTQDIWLETNKPTVALSFFPSTTIHCHLLLSLGRYFQAAIYPLMYHPGMTRHHLLSSTCATRHAPSALFWGSTLLNVCRHERATLMSAVSTQSCKKHVVWLAMFVCTTFPCAPSLYSTARTHAHASLPRAFQCYTKG